MKNAKRFLLVAGLLAFPTTGSAQELTHFSIGIGLVAQTHPVYWPGFAVGLAHRPRFEGALFGFGASAHESSLAPGHPDYDYGYGHHGGWGPYDCWDYLWYDPWFGCDRYVFVGYSSFGWRNPHHAWWWPPGFLGWPSPRYVRHHWYAYGPFWYGGWNWSYPRYHRGHYYSPHRYGYHGYDGGGYLTPRGYRSGGQAKPRGYSGDRIVRGSPLFGPRYKEDPTVYVTDNGRERPVSRAMPRGSRSDVVDPTGRRRSTEASDTRRARPRSETASAPTRSAPPKLRTRTGSPPKARATPTRRPTPKARPTTPTRPTSTARPKSTRRATPTARPATARRPAPTARPSRTPAPKAKARTLKRSAPKVRPPAPTKRPPPKASAPKRSAPKARPAPRRSGNSKKAPPRRGGKD